ncbi:MAG: hypothetical protein WCC37_00470 [Candidatus Sulfotelmatobacter sp.]
MQVGKSLPRIFRKLGERTSEFVRRLKSLQQHHVIDGQRKQRVGLAREIGDAILDRGVHDGVGIELVRDRLVVLFEQVLVEAVAFVEQLES